MLFSYNEMKSTFKSDYQIKKQLKEKKYFKIISGVYSTQKYPSKEAVLAKKYKFILTLNSALFYYGLTDYYPEVVTVQTPIHSYTLDKNLCKQYYISDKFYTVGVEQVEIDNVLVSIYSKERLLVEVLRNKSKFYKEEYYHILKKYKRIGNELNLRKIIKYSEMFREYEKIQEELQLIML